MSDHPPRKPGYVRIALRLPPGEWTAGRLAGACGIDLDHLGPIAVEGYKALVDVQIEHFKAARSALEKLGPTGLVEVRFVWLRLAIGRNHGVTLGQLKKILLAADAFPLGRFNLNNTHSVVGIQDHRADAVVAKLAGTRLNGYAVRPELPPPGAVLGDPAFHPNP